MDTMELDNNRHEYDDVDMSEESDGLENLAETDLDLGDENEEELERLIFGDDQFRQTVHEFSQTSRKPPRTVEKEVDGLEDFTTEKLQDEDLFFVDVDPDAATLAKALQKVDVDDSESEDDVSGAPAWRDSDDERLVVSLASSQRLRKLRVTEEEDVMNGREYSRRLRRQ
jgi:U3 small nucleolar RNA-associated protein 18